MSPISYQIVKINILKLDHMSTKTINLNNLKMHITACVKSKQYSI